MKSVVSSSVLPLVTTAKMASGFRLGFFLCLTSGLFIAGTMSQADSNEQASGCPPGWTQLGSRCFIFYHMSKTWSDAEDTCISVGGNLASVHSDEENVFLRDMVERVAGQRLHTWIGGFDAVTEGRWMWTDGSKFDYVRWSIGEPNNYGIENCAEMNFGGNYWNDSRCHDARSFVCSKDVDASQHEGN